MADRAKPEVYSIAAHRGFADALVAGLIPRYAEPDLGLARLILLLPSQRAVRTVTEAFVRLSGNGLLLPRMAVVGDLDLDETLGAALDPLGAGAEVPPAADPVFRWLRLAHYLELVEGDGAGKGPTVLRRAFEIGRTMDRLLVEGIAPGDLLSDRVIGIVGEQAAHWKDSVRTFATVQQYWLAELDGRGEVDAPQRRNLLFERASRRWKAAPPAGPVVAAGITSASPALAGLLRTIAGLPQGAVILPDLDLALDQAVWNGLGSAGQPPEPGDPPFGRGDAATHPQYHLKLLLNRMGIAREEVRPWHRAGAAAAPPERSRAISNLFLPPEGSAHWVDLPADRRRLAGVRLMETAHPGEEAQAVAILVREALETPGRRVSVITPDRGLAARIVAQLLRWGIVADDSAGLPLSQTTAGRLLLLLAEVVAERASPVPLIALLTHPLTGRQQGRAGWLDNARALDLALRGPRPAPGLAGIAPVAAEARIAEWWAGVCAMLAPLESLGEGEPLLRLLDALAGVAEALCGEDIWAGADGRALSSFVDDLRGAAADAGTRIDPRDLHAVLRDAMDRVSVRPPWGGHPRVAIYGLLEARMSRADLVICAGLVEGVWPGSPSPDALLPPAVLRALGVPGADFRIGLAAHDLAAALGAPEVVLSWARRDEAAPVIPSRFVLRVKAMLGERLLAEHRETDAVGRAGAIDDAAPATPYPRPQPMPDAQQRRVSVSATGLDRLRSDPYQFYASAILGLRALEPLDAEPTARWKGEAAHRILEDWHKAGEPPDGLIPIAEARLDEMSAHPLVRGLWRPRLLAALEWIAQRIAHQKADGRTVIATEKPGGLDWRGIRINAKADRIDRLPGGGLAVVDYKTGKPPSARAVEEGFSLQLGLIGLIARNGGYEGIAGEPEVFEYWSLGKSAEKRDDAGLGYVVEPIRKDRMTTGVTRDDFLPETERYLNEALDRWILGTEPFTARLNPDIGGFNDFDQLMRLGEWLTRLDAKSGGEANP